MKELNADVNAADNGGDTAVMDARSQGHHDIVKMLKECGAHDDEEEEEEK